MRPVVIALLLAACGPPPRAKSAPEQPARLEQPAQPAPARTVDDVALRFARAAAAGDAATARSLALTYDEIVNITTKAPSRESFDAALDDVLEQMAQKTEKGAAVEVTGVKVIETRELGPPKEKLKRPVSAAIVEFELSRDGQPGKTHGWLFLKTATRLEVLAEEVIRPNSWK